MLESLSSIYLYLHFGYLPVNDLELSIILPLSDPQWIKEYRKNLSYEHLVKKGAATLENALENTLKEVVEHSKDVRHVVPISGGLDSRAILSWLVKHIDPTQIYTVTFGVPGAWDFEIGQLVAKQAGVKNEVIDFSSINWHTDDLLHFANLCERPLPVFEGYLFHQIRILLGTDCIYWSGYMGEAISGAHLLERDSPSWEQAVKNFVVGERLSQSEKLTPPHFNIRESFSAQPLNENVPLDFDDQLDFGIRQQSYIRPLVQIQGYQYATPFTHYDWSNFMLQVPRKYRKNQTLYKDILKTNYPFLFSLPTKANFGLPLDTPLYKKASRLINLKAHAGARKLFPRIGYRLSPWTNYIDFDAGLREHTGLREAVHENIEDLIQRKIIDWLDLQKLWVRHQQRQGNFADALILLASLEINLKGKCK